MSSQAPRTVSYSVVDVFSSKPYKGNPLAVVDNSADDLTDTQMKLIARQFNLSETTFFSPPTQAGATYRLRSFLPDGKEVFGAGHNILGVWWFLAQDGRLTFDRGHADNSTDTEVFTFYQELGTDVTPVKISCQRMGSEATATFSVSLRQAPPNAHGHHPDRAALANSIGLTTDEIGIENDNDINLMPQVMSTSTTRHLMVPVSSVAALDRVVVQRDKLIEQLRLVDADAYGIYLFTPVQVSRNSVNTFRARFFSPGMSSEDPATGSAAGPLSAYLHNQGLVSPFNRSASIEVHQGEVLGRECVIHVALSSEGDGLLNVDIAGDGARVADGRLVIPDVSISF